MDDTGKLVFQFFNEVGIIQQLSSSLLNKRLPDGLHASHFGVLNHMVRLGDGQTPLALASAFQVTKGTMTHTLTTLSKRGLVRLAPHKTDGRSKVVFITDAGRALHKHSIELLAPGIAALSEKIDWEEVIKLIPELQKIRIILDENRDI